MEDAYSDYNLSNNIEDWEINGEINKWWWKMWRVDEYLLRYINAALSDRINICESCCQRDGNLAKWGLEQFLSFIYCIYKLFP